MRWIHLTIIGVFVAATILFGMQNLQVVTISFLGFSIRAPLAILAAIFYLLGAATGGSPFTLLRRSIRRSRTRRPAAP
jgi:putative membrane protein